MCPQKHRDITLRNKREKGGGRKKKKLNIKDNMRETTNCLNLFQLLSFPMVVTCMRCSTQQDNFQTSLQLKVIFK